METKDTHRILGYEFSPPFPTFLCYFILLCLSFPCFIRYIFCQITRYLSSEFFILYKSRTELIMIFLECVRLWNPLSKVNARPLVTLFTVWQSEDTSQCNKYKKGYRWNIFCKKGKIRLTILYSEPQTTEKEKKKKL